MVRWFFSHVCNGKFVVFWVALLDAYFFPNIINIIDVLTRAHSRLAAELLSLRLAVEAASLSLGFSFTVVLFSLHASQLVVQYST